MLLELQGNVADPYYLPHRTKITAGLYCEVLTQLRRVIQNTRRGNFQCFCSTVTLVHTLLVRPKTCLRIFDGYFRTSTLLPDFAPSNFHFFPQLKQHLGGIWANKDDLKEEVERQLTSMAAYQYDTISKNPLPQYQKYQLINFSTILKFKEIM